MLLCYQPAWRIPILLRQRIPCAFELTAPNFDASGSPLNLNVSRSHGMGLVIAKVSLGIGMRATSFLECYLGMIVRAVSFARNTSSQGESFLGLHQLFRAASIDGALRSRCLGRRVSSGRWLRPPIPSPPSHFLQARPLRRFEDHYFLSSQQHWAHVCATLSRSPTEATC